MSERMETILHPVTKRPMVTAEGAARLIGVHPSHIRNWGRLGKLTKYVASPRSVWYDRAEVMRRDKEATATKKKRGGRPRSGESAA